MRHKTTIFYTLTDTRWSAALFILALFSVYAVLPIFAHYLLLPNQYFVDLAQLSAIACVAICLGYFLPLVDHRFREGAPRIAIDSQAFHVVVWGTFLVFLLITFATADAVPIFSALKGGATVELDEQRGEFLKGRVGVEAALSYLSTFYVSALLPYSLAKLFIERSRFRYLLLMLFLAFSMSFLVKSLFIYVLVPLFYLAVRQKRSILLPLSIVIGSLVLLYLMTLLAVQFDADTVAPSGGDFFDATYASSVSSGPIEFLLWRSIAVPMFTASDTLLVFKEQLDGQLLWGATSSFLAWIFSLERVNLERLVFAQQFGGWNDLANSNSVYFTEAFANFGWGGVVLFSLFIGQSLRWFRKSRDEAFKALWIIYCFALFSGGLIPLLLSNGYFWMFVLALFIKVKSGSRRLARRYIAAERPARVAVQHSVR